ncbi:MFS transporter [Anoxybacterium hadale]|uniref:MFS transporter n=1 Tax=Anoxybacterium hadale TaxID=3408580 RepID=UPI003AFFF359
MNKVETGFGKKGWILIIYCLITFYVCTAFKDTMNVAVYTFQEKYGWSQTLLLSLASIGSYVTCIVIYILGILNATGKLKLRNVALITGLIYACTISLWGLIHSLGIFIVNYIVMTVGYTVWSQYANNSICANWFPKKSGAVLGWTTIGFPLAAATNALLFMTLMKHMTFEKVYLLFGILTLFVCIWGYFGFRDYPEEMGYHPDNDTSMTQDKIKEFLEQEDGISKSSIWTTSRMLATKETWFISISNGVMLLLASGSMGQMVVRFVSGGMELEMAIKMMTVVGIFAMVGSWAFGKYDYRAGVKKAVLLGIVMMFVACGLYSINSFVPMVVGAAIIGAGLGGSSNFVVSCTSYYWKRKNFKKAYGTILTITTVIGSAGALVVANLANVFNYSVAYWLLMVLAAIAFLCMLFVKEGFVERYEEQLSKI